MATYTVLTDFCLSPSRVHVTAGTELVVGVDINQAKADELLASGTVRPAAISQTPVTPAQGAARYPGFSNTTPVIVEARENMSLRGAEISGPTSTVDDEGVVSNRMPGDIFPMSPAEAVTWQRVGAVSASPVARLHVTNGNNGTASYYSFVALRVREGSRIAYLENGMQNYQYGLGVASQATIGTATYAVLEYLQDEVGYYYLLDDPVTDTGVFSCRVLGTYGEYVPVGTETGVNFIFTANTGFDIDLIEGGTDPQNLTELEPIIDGGTGAATVASIVIASTDDYYITSTYQAE